MLTGLYPYDGAPRSNIVLRLSNTWQNEVTGGLNPNPNTTLYPRPTTVADYMSYNGNQCIRWSDGSDKWRVTSPYSVEMDVYCENTLNGKWIATCGEGFGGGWGEWSIIQSGGKIILVSSSDNNGNQFSLDLVPVLNAKQWYRIGFMFYTVGSQYRIRGYTNDVQVFDQACLQPYDSLNGMMIGGDLAWDSSQGGKDRKWTGRIRNLTLARSLLWTV